MVRLGSVVGSCIVVHHVWVTVLQVGAALMDVNQVWLLRLVVLGVSHVRVRREAASRSKVKVVVCVALGPPDNVTVLVNGCWQPRRISVDIVEHINILGVLLLYPHLSQDVIADTLDYFVVAEEIDQQLLVGWLELGNSD